MPKQINNQTKERAILNLRAKGFTYREIAKKLKCSKATISYWLDPKGKEKVVARNKRYKGKFGGRWASRRGALWKYNYLLERSCEYCGESDMLKLQFDHKSEYEKHSNITNLLNGNLDKLKAEVKKCRVLCANCHQAKTMKERNAAFYVVYEEQKARKKEYECKG
jgi:5-methylcytosine-specific restriction endonuclease McrA